MSDTHGIISYANEVLQRMHNIIDAVLHLGDGYSDVKIFENQYEDLDFFAVLGNCDGSSINNETEKILNINGKKILMTHGHQSKHKVKYDYKTIISYATKQDVDICLFGHTHYPITFVENNIIFMNPGSLSMPREVNYVSYGMIEIDKNGLVNFDIFGKTSENYVSIKVIQ